MPGLPVAMTPVDGGGVRVALIIPLLVGGVDGVVRLGAGAVVATVLDGCHAVKSIFCPGRIVAYACLRAANAAAAAPPLRFTGTPGIGGIDGGGTDGCIPVIAAAVAAC